LSVSTGDFNFDGRLDLLVTTQNTETKKNTVRYYLRSEKAPYYGNFQYVNYVLKVIGQGTSKADFYFDLPDQAQPFVIDSNGNRQ